MLIRRDDALGQEPEADALKDALEFGAIEVRPELAVGVVVVRHVDGDQRQAVLAGKRGFFSRKRLR